MGSEGYSISWEEKAAELGLDDLCMSALSAVPSERAHQILNDIHTKAGEIRSLSAYVNKAARQHWDEKEILRRALEADIWKDLLDDSAKGELRNVEPSCALAVLKDVRHLGSNVRNPSSYVCGTVRKRVAEGKLVAAVGGFQSSRSEHTPQRGSSQGQQQQLATLQPQQTSMMMGGASSSANNQMFMRAAMPAMAAAMMPGCMMWPFAMMQQAFATQAAAAFAQQAFATQSASSSTPIIRILPANPPQPKPREASQIDKLEIDAVIAELVPDLDEKAVERVYQLGSAEEARKALEVLVEMGDEVRNKSAFINGVVNKRLQAGMGGPEDEEDKEKEAERFSEWEDQLETFKEELDEQAINALKDVQAQMGTGAGIQLLKDLTSKKEAGGIRNLSGFAYKMARTRLSGGVQGGGPPNITIFSPAPQADGWSDRIDTEINESELAAEFQNQMDRWSQDLDERAVKIMNDLQIRAGTSVALDVLKELEIKVNKDELRNVSSFVYSMARQRIQGTPMPDKKDQWDRSAMPSAFAAMAMDGGPTPRSIREAYLPAGGSAKGGHWKGYSGWEDWNDRTSNRKGGYSGWEDWNDRPHRGYGKARSQGDGGTASLPWIQDMMEKYDLKGKLDEICLQHMLTAQKARIEEILEDINDIGDVRNPSAFIQKSLKDCPDPGLIRKRGRSDAAQDGNAWESVKRAHLEPESSEDPLLKYKELVNHMDEAAVGKLRNHPDQSRVRDILAEMATKILDIRNPSAFVVRALNDPTKGGSLGPMY